MTDTHPKVEKMLNYLTEGFLHFKPTVLNQVKAVKIAQNEVRIGVTHVSDTKKPISMKTSSII